MTVVNEKRESKMGHTMYVVLVDGRKFLKANRTCRALRVRVGGSLIWSDNGSGGIHKIFTVIYSRTVTGGVRADPRLCCGAPLVSGCGLLVRWRGQRAVRWMLIGGLFMSMPPRTPNATDIPAGCSFSRAHSGARSSRAGRLARWPLSVEPSRRASPMGRPPKV